MKVLLAQRASYVPTHGGANKANRCIMEKLAAHGHSCRVLVSIKPMQNYGGEASLADHLRSRNIPFSKSDQDVEFVLNNVAVYGVGEIGARAILQSSGLRQKLQSDLIHWDPDVVLIASEDQFQFLLSTAVNICPEKTVYLARCSSMLGVGPFAFFPNPRCADLLRSVAAIVCNSRYLQGYVKKWIGVVGEVMDFQTYGEPPFVDFGAKSTNCITIVNPCTVKGISIFLELAKSLPKKSFQAVRGWGTTRKDMEALSEMPNVRVTGPFDDVDEMFGNSRVVVVPSLWDEAFGRVVIEAMLRGIPVIAANVGGLPEAGLGAAILLPISVILRFKQRFDDAFIPEAEIPRQDIRPWKESLERLTEDEAYYRTISTRCRQAALNYVQALRFEPFEQLLFQVKQRQESSGIGLGLCQSRTS
jgi:glycosyltransferase involved in cell wall biosynthesis